MRRKGVKRIVFTMLFMLAAVFLFTVPVQAASAKLSKKSATLVVGETLKLKVTGGLGKVTWSSKDKKIATVSKDGLVTAKKTGNCTITVKKGSKKLTCKVKVKALPKDYATVNGKKVKVGGTVRITYKIQSKQPISGISIKYWYNRKALEILTDEDDRFKVWLCNESYPTLLDKGKPYYLVHLWGMNPKDPYNPADISCTKAKTVDSMKIKVLKSGNYKMDAEFYNISSLSAGEVKDYKITTTVK